MTLLGSRLRRALGTLTPCTKARTQSRQRTTSRTAVAVPDRGRFFADRCCYFSCSDLTYFVRFEIRMLTMA